MNKQDRVWYAIPSKYPHSSESLKRWRAAGYRLALYRDAPEGGLNRYPADCEIYGEYKGYAHAVNTLCFTILDRRPQAQIIITGGDDIDPVPDREPVDLAGEFVEHFGGTLGVMQPCGDPWMKDESGRSAAERVCGSPWMGRDFIERVNQGAGPIWHEYFHFFEDEELHDVTEKLGLLWNRRDLTQYHHHWSRKGEPRPKYLHEKRLDWDKAKRLFQSRKARGFPGHELLAEEV